MLLIVKMLLSGLLLNSSVLFIVWLRQLKTKNAGIVDAWWAYNFTFLIVLFYFLTLGSSIRIFLLMAMVMFWSIRLGTYLLIRNSFHGNKEDIRYALLRKGYEKNANRKMLSFFLIQAFSNVLLSIPFLLVFIDQDSSVSFFEISGSTIWLVGFVGESVADKQLKSFKKESGNEGKVCQKGLWKYSRHPNYFFEWLIWVGFAVYALSSPFGWLALTSPIIMYFLLNNVTGVPMLEKLAVLSKGEAYINYQKTTNPFFPWFRKK